MEEERDLGTTLLVDPEVDTVPAGASKHKRLMSLDIQRGLTIGAMVFADEARDACSPSMLVPCLGQRPLCINPAFYLARATSSQAN